MTKLEMADFLEYYNLWRRDPNVPNALKMPNPTEIGKVIDMVIEELRKC